MDRAQLSALVFGVMGQMVHVQLDDQVGGLHTATVLTHVVDVFVGLDGPSDSHGGDHPGGDNLPTTRNLDMRPILGRGPRRDQTAV